MSYEKKKRSSINPTVFGAKGSKEKDTNPKDAVGVKKVGISTLSFVVLLELALAVLEGARKYGKFNWRKVGVRSSVYIDAAFRHMAAYQEGEDIDKDSGMHHIVKAEACLHILRDAQIRGMVTDDRPPATLGFLPALNKKAAAVIAMHPKAKRPVTREDASPAIYK